MIQENYPESFNDAAIPSRVASDLKGMPLAYYDVDTTEGVNQEPMQYEGLVARLDPFFITGLGCFLVAVAVVTFIAVHLARFFYQRSTPFDALKRWNKDVREVKNDDL